MKNIKGSIILLIAAFIWGTAFVAQTSASDNVGAFTFTALRSAIGATFLGVFMLLRKLYFNMSKKEVAKPVDIKRSLVGGAICGIVLFFATNLQQLGITVYPEGVASSGRAGFITATYVVMVAISGIFFGKKLHPVLWAAVAGCVAGMYMLCLSGGFSGVYFGDVLVFLCAICFTAHILVVDRFSDIDSILLCCLQFTVTGIISAILMLIFETPDINAIMAAWLPIAFTGIMSSGVAYTLQMAGQKHAEPAVASIVMSLESVFSVLAGWVILGETLTTRELIGCVLVFAAVIMAQLPEFFKDRKKS
ncbi:MAG: DMT family transporter [Oscillospiraceae bacterium]